MKFKDPEELSNRTKAIVICAIILTIYFIGWGVLLYHGSKDSDTSKYEIENIPHPEDIWWADGVGMINYDANELVIHSEGITRNVLQNEDIMYYTVERRCITKGKAIGSWPIDFTLMDTDCFYHILDQDGVSVSIIPEEDVLAGEKEYRKTHKEGEKWQKKSENTSKFQSPKRLEDFPWMLYMMPYAARPLDY